MQQAAPIAAVDTKLSGPITLDVFADMIEVSQLLETVDLGATVVHKVLHPVAGQVVLVNTAGGNSAIMYM